MEILTVKYLVIQTAFPGDAILTLPMIQVLKEHEPDSNIDVLAIPATELIFNHSVKINDVIVYDKRGKDKSVFSFISLIEKIRKRKYDIVISPHRSARSALIAFFSGAANTISFNKSSLAFLYKNKRDYDAGAHEVKRNLDLINFDTSGNKWKILPRLTTSEEEGKINRVLEELNITKPVAIAPGSVWKTKRYPVEHYIQIVKTLVNEKHNVVIIGGKEDEELGEKLSGINPGAVKNFAGRLNITESTALLKNCILLVSNDSAPTHMGMAAGIPVITIYCSTIAGFGFYPYNSKSSIVSYDELECKPCGIHGYRKCPLGHFKCGYNLLPDIVIEEISKILAKDIHQ